jgi:hypothetical protein
LLWSRSRFRGAGFVVNQAAKRFGAAAKPFSEAREGIPKLSPVNPKTVARETRVFDHVAPSWVDANVTPAQRRFTSPGQAWIVWGPTMQPQEMPPLWVLLTLVLIIVSAGMYLTTYLEDSRVAVSAETSLLARGLK